MMIKKMSASEAGARTSLLQQTKDAVVALARKGAHGREIRDYLIDQAPMRTDPAQFIESLVTEGLIIRSSLDPYKNQYPGGNYGNPICHPTHYRYYAP